MKWGGKEIKINWLPEYLILFSKDQSFLLPLKPSPTMAGKTRSLDKIVHTENR